MYKALIGLTLRIVCCLYQVNPTVIAIPPEATYTEYTAGTKMRIAYTRATICKTRIITPTTGKGTFSYVVGWL